MKSTTQLNLDRLSIGASAVCALHCAAIPILLTTFPALSFFPSEEHIFHQALVWLILPISLLAGYLGCNKHKDIWVMSGIAIGLVVLLCSALLGHDLIGETMEKTLTLIAALILALAHWRNYALCRAEACDN